VAIAPDLVVEARGDGRARGRAHGEALRDRILAGLERWDADVERRIGPPAAGYVARLVGETRFLPVVERHAADLLDEVRGIAEGAGVKFERILAYNLMDEEWWFSQTPGVRQACSLVAVAAQDGRPALLAQNMDLPDVMDGGQAVLRSTAADGVESVVLTAAGMIGLTGVNSEGLGVCVNTLSMLHHSDRGVPVAFVMRGILERRTVADAARFLESVPHASGQHYALGSAEAVAGYECSASGAVRSDASAARFCHTNHPLASDDLDPADEHPDGYPDSHVRLARVEAAAGGIRTGEDCRELLADREAPLCVHATADDPWLTFASIVMELGDRTEVAIAPGPPDTTGWVDVPFTAA
jgi:isopenicillin-N N-acyltransferase like protein